MTHSLGRLCVGPEPALEEADAKLVPPQPHVPHSALCSSSFALAQFAGGMKSVGRVLGISLPSPSALELDIRAGGGGRLSDSL